MRQQIGFLLVLGVLFVGSNAQEHFIDVRELVQDTLDAIKDVPAMMDKNGTVVNSTASALIDEVKTDDATNNVYKSLLKLPADIMSRLAQDVGIATPSRSSKQDISLEKPTVNEAVIDEKNKMDVEDSSPSFKTVEDAEAEERKRINNDTPTMVKKNLEDNEDIFSISKLISATGNAIREAQAAQLKQQSQPTIPPLVPLPSPLEMPGLNIPMSQPAVENKTPNTEVFYRPLVRDGKTVYEQIIILKSADGSSKIVSQSIFNQLPIQSTPVEQKKLQIKQMKKLSKAKEHDFMAPTFPPMVNVFDQFSQPAMAVEPMSTTEPTSTTTEEPKITTTEESSTTEEPATTASVVEGVSRRRLPRRKIQYLEKKRLEMHSRQFGAKTLQMSDPINIQAQDDTEAQNVLQKEGTLRVRTIDRKSKKTRKQRPDKMKRNKKEEAEKIEEEEESATEPPKKRRKLIKRSKKTQKKQEEEKKEIRTFPELYEEQFKTQVAPSVASPSEDFVEQFANIDEAQERVKETSVEKRQQQIPQNDTPIDDKMERKSSKVHQMTKDEIEKILEKEIHRRVMKKIHSAKTKSAEEQRQQNVEMSSGDDEDVNEDDDEVEITTTEAPTTTTTTTKAPLKKSKKSRKTKKPIVNHQQCLNLRSFARQFLFDTIDEFAKEHCYFIENYYPKLTCAKVSVYVSKCKKLMADE